MEHFVLLANVQNVQLDYSLFIQYDRAAERGGKVAHGDSFLT